MGPQVSRILAAQSTKYCRSFRLLTSTCFISPPRNQSRHHAPQDRPETQDFPQSAEVLHHTRRVNRRSDAGARADEAARGGRQIVVEKDGKCERGAPRRQCCHGNASDEHLSSSPAEGQHAISRRSERDRAARHGDDPQRLRGRRVVAAEEPRPLSSGWPNETAAPTAVQSSRCMIFETFGRSAETSVRVAPAV